MHKNNFGMSITIRTISFYVYLLHLLSASDTFWNTGVTQWRKITKAEALFQRHCQPLS
ncbi:MAG: glycoside hydrolase family 99-like domain-containing protein [Sulfuriferula sp.]